MFITSAHLAVKLCLQYIVTWKNNTATPLHGEKSRLGKSYKYANTNIFSNTGFSPKWLLGQLNDIRSGLYVNVIVVQCSRICRGARFGQQDPQPPSHTLRGWGLMGEKVREDAINACQWNMRQIKQSMQSLQIHSTHDTPLTSLQEPANLTIHLIPALRSCLRHINCPASWRTWPVPPEQPPPVRCAADGRRRDVWSPALEWPHTPVAAERPCVSSDLPCLCAATAGCLLAGTSALSSGYWTARSDSLLMKDWAEIFKWQPRDTQAVWKVVDDRGGEGEINI